MVLKEVSDGEWNEKTSERLTRLFKQWCTMMRTIRPQDIKVYVHRMLKELD